MCVNFSVGKHSALFGDHSLYIHMCFTSIISILSIVIIHRLNLAQSLLRPSCLVKHICHYLLGVVSLILLSDCKISTKSGGHVKLRLTRLPEVAELQNANV